MSADSTKKTLGVALGVCLVCSVFVSTAAVSLNSIQVENKRLDKIKNILIAGNLYTEETNINKTYETKVEPNLLELSNGEILTEDKFTDVLSIESFDIKAYTQDPELGRDIDDDIAGIKRMPKFMSIYFVKNQDKIERIILPVYGKGLWSTMYGFIAIGSDLKTVDGFTFYQHGETPGLGGEVDNIRWKEMWKGKKLYNENDELKINVLKGKVDPTNPNAKYQIDGLSGATITTKGVDLLVKFWLGNEGYAPFLAKLKKEANNEKI